MPSKIDWRKPNIISKEWKELLRASAVHSSIRQQWNVSMTLTQLHRYFWSYRVGFLEILFHNTTLVINRFRCLMKFSNLTFWSSDPLVLLLDKISFVVNYIYIDIKLTLKILIFAYDSLEMYIYIYNLLTYKNVRLFWISWCEEEIFFQEEIK